MGEGALYRKSIQSKEDKTKQIFRIKGQQRYVPFNVDVEGDWSGASFLLTAGAMAGRVRVNNLNLNSVQVIH